MVSFVLNLYLLQNSEPKIISGGMVTKKEKKKRENRIDFRNVINKPGKSKKLVKFIQFSLK